MTSNRDIVDNINEQLHWQLSEQTSEALEALPEHVLQNLEGEIQAGLYKVRQPFIERINQLRSTTHD